VGENSRQTARRDRTYSSGRMIALILIKSALVSLMQHAQHHVPAMLALVQYRQHI
jgi:hypothetical protein